MEKLIKLLEEVNDAPDYINASALVDDGLLDSFDIVSIIAALDDEYGVTVTAGDILPENFNSAAAILALVGRLK